jgi:hypothetical protein
MDNLPVVLVCGEAGALQPERGSPTAALRGLGESEANGFRFGEAVSEQQLEIIFGLGVESGADGA